MKISFDYLKKLKKNNNREWFNANKDEFLKSKMEFEGFVQEVVAQMEQHDRIDIGNTKVFRIYRDVRFSKDKTPYSPYWRAHIRRAGKELRGGYYLHVEPGKTILVAGFFQPEPADLLHIRKQVSLDPDVLRALMKQSKFKNYFGEMDGERVKTAPKGFSKEDPAIDLLRFKSLYFNHGFKDSEVLDSNFAKAMSDGFKNVRPFFNYMSEILTTDFDGKPMV